ncbi:MAG: tRNA uridine-5-carboxymethylaminomethyl(34) synthesis GTPase MnmE, partial [Chitinophagaceae bacterium]|nr:tRNA uridine-5-carboxymethylaminomethyl(34) synthesis GTPase MnmE [Chitinophagaceae bacterium]
MNTFMGWDDTIVALATPHGVGAISVIRLSGEKSIDIVNALFRNKDLSLQKSHTLHVGILENGDEQLDEVVVALYKSPRSYTGEHIVEISCHGSPFIQQRILEACVQKGARLALPGEFTQRAFLNGKMDLAQAEAVADIIAAGSYAAKQTALNQLRGGFSSDLKSLRDELIHFTALVELELDFSDEDVEFVDRSALRKLVETLARKTDALIASFKLGNVIKNGVSVAIIGKPNVGKSTLLNALLNEERAIVSDIAGTTRDTIEETLNIGGILFRLIDTAGIREHSTDVIENKGIERSKANAFKADIILHVVDLLNDEGEEKFNWLDEFREKTITIYNKYHPWYKKMEEQGILPTPPVPAIDAKSGFGIDELKQYLYKKVMEGKTVEGSIVTNARHYEALLKVRESLTAVRNGLDSGLTGDLL